MPTNLANQLAARSDVQVCLNSRVSRVIQECDGSMSVECDHGSVLEGSVLNIGECDDARHNADYVIVTCSLGTSPASCGHITNIELQPPVTQLQAPATQLQAPIAQLQPPVTQLHALLRC